MASTDRKGRTAHEHGTFIQRRLLLTPAWRALSPKAQMIYIWLRLEWKGAKYNNNGSIRLSYRQAADRVGIGVNTAMKGFQELQAKGFIVVTRKGALGLEGHARGPTYELTEISTPIRSAKLLYSSWTPGNDFPVVRHQVNNPGGSRRINPSQDLR